MYQIDSEIIAVLNEELRTKIMRSLLSLNYLIAITDIVCMILRMSMEDY